MPQKTENQGLVQVSAAALEHIESQTYLLKNFICEFMGSFAIVYFGNWAQIFSDLGQSNMTAVAVAVGFICTIFTWLGANISGAYYNPCTTVSMLYMKRLTFGTAICYWIF